MPVPKLSLVLVVLLATPLAWAIPAPGLLDDAGSGQDAGATPQTAMPLPYGEHHGNLTPGDADWFRYAPTGPVCLSASAIAMHAMQVDLRVGTLRVGGILSDEGIFSTAVAVSGAPVHLGILPDEAPWDHVSVGPYAASVQANAPTVVGDNATHDAPPTTAQAAPIPASCFGAYFKSAPVDVDVWSVQAGAGETIVVSLAMVNTNASGTVSLLNAAGSSVAGPVGPGSAISFPVPGAGTYYVSAESPHSGNTGYILATSVGPDPGAGCRPGCFH